jgi:hypothetical protein
MKTILLLLFLLLPIVTFADPSDSRFIGHFRYADSTQSSEYTFHEDGTFDGSAAVHKKVVWEYAGTWSIGDGMLNYVFTKSSIESVPAGTVAKHKILEIKSDYFVVRDPSTGRRRLFSRVRE